MLSNRFTEYSWHLISKYTVHSKRLVTTQRGTQFHRHTRFVRRRYRSNLMCPHRMYSVDAQHFRIMPQSTRFPNFRAERGLPKELDVCRFSPPQTRQWACEDHDPWMTEAQTRSRVSNAFYSRVSQTRTDRSAMRRSTPCQLLYLPLLRSDCIPPQSTWRDTLPHCTECHLQGLVPDPLLPPDTLYL